MVHFSLSVLAIMVSATFVTAAPVGPRQNTPQPRADLTSLGLPSGDLNAPNSEPEPQGDNPVPQPGPLAYPTAAPQASAPAPEPFGQDGTGAGVPDANPFTAGPGGEEKSTAETYIDALSP